MQPGMPYSNHRSPFDGAVPRDGAAPLRDGTASKAEDRHDPNSNGADSSNAGIPPADLLAALQAQLAEARMAIGDYFYTLADQARVGVRDLISQVALAVGALAGGVMLAAVGMIMLLFGLAEGTNALFGWPHWAGYLVVGLVGVVAPLVISLRQLASWKSRWLEEAKGRYERRNAKHARQRHES